ARRERQLDGEPAYHDLAVVEEFGKRARTAWGVLDAHLGGRSFVAADRPTIADLSLCGYLFWPDELGVEWDEFPQLRDWLARLRALPRWKAPYDLMPATPNK
ncbi:MAG: glutathione S-transferase C-terminal domain-containing protein, partial [Betaproteobacteria bacterium]